MATVAELTKQFYNWVERTRLVDLPADEHGTVRVQLTEIKEVLEKQLAELEQLEKWMSEEFSEPGSDQKQPQPQSVDFDSLLNDLRAIIGTGRGRAVAALNTEVVITYWQIGERIVLEEQQGAGRAAYGEQLLARLGRILSREFGRGFAESSLRNMRQFYLTYPIRSALRSELTWTHYRTLMRLPDPVQREFYARLSVSGRWSSRELDRQMGSMLYERAERSRKPDELAPALPVPDGFLASYDPTFRDPYVLDFLGLQEVYSERDLEAALVLNIERFLLELGSDFCFVGRQRRLTIGGDDYYVDLVFFHRTLRCLVLVDLKIGAFSPSDAAQMKLYLNWYRRHDKREGEDDPIGLILCGSKNEQVVELLLADPDNSMDHRIRVAQYLLLHNEEAIKERLASLSEAYEQMHAGSSGSLAPPDDAGRSNLDPRLDPGALGPPD